MAFNPTEQQNLAINTKGNILVSAAAGSGKTAVLVERVIKLLTDENSRVRADELLIVTFTNAAAAEMRARIEKRINEVCLDNPNNPALMEQKHLLGNAKICTIDSFCIDLVRENFDKLDILPDFKISDNVSLEEINQNVVYKILGQYIDSGNETVSQLADLVGGEYDEGNLANTILELYSTSRQLPYPDVWYDELLKGYNNGTFNSESVWYKYAISTAKETANAMQNMLANTIDLISQNITLADHYLPTLTEVSYQLNDLYDSAVSNDWDKLYNFLKAFKIMSLPTAIKGTAKSPDVLAIKDVFEYYTDKAIPKLQKLFYGDLSYISAQFTRIYKPLELLIELLKEFEHQVFEEYKRQNIFTFHNIEHLALKLLCDRDENGNIVPSSYAKEITEQYAEVMVDEYQDTNDLQDSLFYALSNCGEKLFIVGDVKQSIYGFRGANPNNFLNKKNIYKNVEKAEVNDPKKIILAQNFRTKDSVCNFINYFFEMFMTDKTGKLIYDSEERLDPKAEYPFLNEIPVDYAVIDCKNTDDKNWVLEARYIGEYIRKITSSGDVIRVDKNTLRPAKYGDFTILMRSLTNANIIINELTSQGIPVDISLDAFAENREISTMLSLLKVIDNPDSDVELLTVLLSPIFAFTPDELAVMRADKKDGTIYSIIIFAANKGNIKAKEFLSKIEQFRTLSVTLTLPELISNLLIKTEFLNIITAFENGEKRKNNLLMLVDYAQQFISANSNSLKRFTDYIYNLSKAGLKTATGNSANNAVKIMTIHGSKGLQFPVCIIAGTASPFNDAESKQHTNYNIDYGIGFKYYDEEEGMPLSTVSREVILDSVYAKSLEEELRLLYVAMTRTQDKMLIISAFDNLETALQKYKNRLNIYKSKISSSHFKRTRSYADWIMPAVLLHKDGRVLRNVDDSFTLSDNTSSLNITVVDGAELLENPYNAPFTASKPNTDLADKIKSNSNYVYPFNDILNIRSKTSVSALANKAESDKFAFTQKPSFMNKGGMSATDRGTAMHRVMQYFDFSKCDDIEEEIERLYEWQYISENEYNSLDRVALKRFFSSEIFDRIKNADLVKREMRFLTEVPATTIDNTLDKRFCDEQIIIQGAVDVCFIEKDGIVILDFKTDRVEEPAALAEAYGMQLSIYALAAQKIFNLPVKEKVIYSFNLGKTITIGD
ncbi:MAG: helicase-exonuclease AddAB subunit AddA [Ruminococcaceae bacterium]|nr:helicase-exonuclease AddAB subunit AddA [Oscillospiraceae bacterium]